MKEIYMLKTLDGFKTVTLEETNQQYGEMEFPYKEV